MSQINEITNNSTTVRSVEEFSALAHIFIALIAGVLLMALWYHIRKKFNQRLKEEEQPQRIDKGLLFLGAAVLVWALLGGWSRYHLENEALEHGVRSLLSTTNNVFLLMALYYLNEAPLFIQRNKRNVKLIVAGLVILSLSSILLFTVYGDKAFSGIRISFLPDFMLSAFLSVLLAVSFFKTFLQRGLRIIAVLSMATVGVMLYSQLPEVFESFQDNFANNLLRIIAKTSLISIFLVLATNWVIQLASTPRPSEMEVYFTDWSLITLTVPSKNIHKKQIDFGSKTTQFKNLLRFSIRRKFGEGDEQYIEIGHGKEIDNQSYLSRIVNNINEIAQLSEDEKLERKDLFTFVGQGKYRLRILPSHINMESTLLEEFVKDKENDLYRSFSNE